MSWQFWVSQVFGVLTLVCVFINFQVRGKRKILAWNIIASVFWLGMFVFANNWVGMFLGAVGIVRGGVFLICDIKSGRAWKIGGKVFLYSILAFGFVMMILVNVNVLPFPFHWWDFFVAAASGLFVIGTYMTSRHVVRIGAFLYACALIIQNAVYFNVGYTDEFNIMGTLIEISKISSVLVFYYFLARKTWLINQLNEIKKEVHCEVSKIKACSDVEELESIISQARLEKLVARMVRYELAVVDRSKISDLRSVEEEVAAVLDDIKTVQDVKELLNKSIDAKRDFLEEIPRVVK